MLLGTLVRESLPFVRRELQSRSVRGRYRLRRSGQTIMIRHGTLDIPTLAEIFLERQYEPPPALAQYLENLGRPPQIVDLGANIGLFGAFMRSRLPQARLTAVEADPENAAVHRDVVAANAAEAVWHLIEAVASVSNDEVAFLAGENVFSRAAEPGSAGNARLVEGLDALPVLGEADLAKIDIEGGEWAILGDSRFQELSPKTLVLEYHSHLCPGPEPRQVALELLREAGYEVELRTERTTDYGTFGMLWAWKPETAQ
jgi:FkbM family methyltransferase